MATPFITSRATVSPEFLGPEATGRDLARFGVAVLNVMESSEYDRKEFSAAEYVWNNGAIRFNAGTCVHCGHVQADTTIVPGIDDDDGWATLAPGHDDDCQWVATRAHRR